MLIRKFIQRFHLCIIGGGRYGKCLDVSLVFSINYSIVCYFSGLIK